MAVRAEVLSSAMTRQRFLLSSAACIIIAALNTCVLFAEEPPCATNYSTDGKTASTFVLTSLTPQEVVQKLPRLLVQNGIRMQWAEPDKGIVKAEELEVKAERVDEVTRVTFRSVQQPPAANDMLCRYASLVGEPPVAKPALVAQDPALVARMKEDLLKKHQIVQPATGRGLNNAAFRTQSDFLDFNVTGTRTVGGKHEYDVSLLVPRAVCGIASEDLDDVSLAMNGKQAAPRTKPVSIKALLVYEGEGAASHLADATIVSIESTK